MNETTAEIEEKKSRFIARLKPVEDLSEAEAFVASLKKKYWDARHNCSAFVLGNDGSITRCSDDGEPSGTAGRPMLEVLTHSKLTNVAVVVTRYFGGTLLGTGGLIRAYTDVVKLAVETALENKDISEVIDGITLTISFEYTLLGKYQHFVQENNIFLLDTIYADNVSMILQFEQSRLDNIIKNITEISSGKAIISEPEKGIFLIPVNE